LHFGVNLVKKIAICAVVLLSGCASISKDECMIGDWYSLGVNDGQRGVLATQFRQYQKECAEYGVQPDFKAYNQGHSQGLVSYCDYPHGEAHGRSGAEYNTACTGKLEPEFRQGYQVGIRWYKAKKVVDDIASAINNLEYRINDLDQELHRTNQQIAAENNPSNRASLLYRTDRIRDEMQGYAAEIGRLQIQLAHAEHEFRQVDR
jgi:outer membrane murein-binding lipoprotein Lpp